MLLHRLYHDGLAQASYLVGCEKSRDAVVIDPNRDVEQYLLLAAALGVRIRHVTETHVHADFVSGALELAARADAQLYLSNAAQADGYAYAREYGALGLGNGDVLEVGKVRLEAEHTPGHTPEHLSFLVTDSASSDVPVGALTGDFLFVGDVGRPDLLERAVGVTGSAATGARQLFRSIRAFLRHPDFLQIWPGHGAGSACGKSLSSTPHSTLGYERIANWALGITDEAEFVRRALEDQTEPPGYFAEMKTVNRTGPRSLASVHRPEQATRQEIAGALGGPGVVLDTRPANTFAREHLAGSVNVPLGKSFLTWAGSVLPYDVPIHLIVDVAPPDLVEAALKELSLIGLDNVRGWSTWDQLAPQAESELPRTSTRQVSVDEFDGDEQGSQIIDVRNSIEWRAGHIQGAIHIPLAALRQRVGEIDTGRPIVVHCQSGARSAVAASVLEAAGAESVANLTGGFAAWRKAGRAVEGEIAR